MPTPLTITAPITDAGQPPVPGDGSPLTLSAAIARVAGHPVALPPELPDVAVEDVAIDVDAATGAVTLDGRIVAGWALPLGGDGLAVVTATLHAERSGTGTDGTAALALAVSVRAEHRLAVADGFVVTAAELTFERNGEGAAWTATGTLDAEVFDHATRFRVEVADDAEGRRFLLAASGADDTPMAAVDLAGVGRLEVRRLVAEARRLPPEAPVVETDPAPAQHTWTVRADGHLDLLDGAIVVDGALSLHGEPGRSAFTLEPAGDGHAADVTVVLPGTEAVAVHLGLGRLDVQRTGCAGSSAWSVRATPSVWFSGLPAALATVLPGSADTELRADLAIDTATASVALVLDGVLARQAIALPTITVLDRDIALGSVAVAVPNLGVRWQRGGGVGVDATFAVGLPAGLNDTLAGGHALFVTYDPTSGDGMVAARLTATSSPGSPALSVALLDSPLAALAFDAPDPDAAPGAPRRATVDLGPYGTLALEVPTISIQGDVVRVAGGFTQRDLALPLAPLAWLLRALDLGRVADLLPHALPLRDLPIASVTGGFDVDALVALVGELVGTPAGAAVPVADELRTTLEPLAHRIGELPERLLPYLDVHVPEHLSFDIAVSTTGAVRGRVAVAGADGAVGRAAPPLRLVFPGLSVTGPVLNGISLWSLSIGEVFGGAAAVATVDADVDQFDLVPLAVTLAAPDEVRAALPSARPLTRRLVADRVTIVVVPEALVAVPAFFEDLGVEYRGIEGIELAAHVSVPHPSLDLRGAITLFRDVRSFLTEPDTLLDEQALAASGLDLRLIAGPAYLQLPEALGGTLLGSRTTTTTVDAGAELAHLLNGLKRLRVDTLLQGLPAELRQGSLPTAPPPHVGPVTLHGDWAVAASDVARGVAVHLAGGADVGPLHGLHGSLDLRTAGRDVGLGVTVDGGDGRLVGLRLDAALDTGAFAAAIDAPALVLADPAVRIVTAGPAWTPDAFTVEWWMCPTALADYDQFVAGDAAWGAFVFHATATGAVYCGTDVATRLTPSDLGPGTLAIGAWQHLAVTYDRGTLVLLRNGIPLATRLGASPPRPWTGMHLGMPEAGTQVTGGIAELRVWATARSASDIASTMHRRLVGTEPGLVGCWPLDERAPMTVFRDRSGHGHDGRVTAGAPAPAAGAATLPAVPLGGPAPAVRVHGDAAVTLFGHTIVAGAVDLRPGHAELAGHLDLFGPNALRLAVTGDVRGSIDGAHLDLRGDVRVALADLALVAARVRLTEDALTVAGRWLDRFTADLHIDTGLGRRVVAGAITGDVPLAVTCPAIYAPTPTGPVKVCDAFTLATTFHVDVAVQADEVTGLWCTGTAAFTVGQQRQQVTLHLASVPTTAQAFTDRIVDAVRGRARQVFDALYPTARDWLAGVTTGGIAWTRTAWDDTASVLGTFFRQSAPQVVSLLGQAAYGSADVGRVLATRFTPDWRAMADAFGRAGADAHTAAGAVFAVFVAPLGQPPIVQARGVASMLSGAYGAKPVATAVHDLFPLTKAETVQVLVEMHYRVDDVAAAARVSLAMGAQETASAFARVGVAGAEALRGLRAAFPDIAASTLATYLQAVGYARDTLNDVLRSLQLPTI